MKLLSIEQSPILQKYMLKYLRAKTMMCITYLKWLRKKIASLDSKEIKPVNPTGNKPWIFIGKTDAEAEASVLWPPDVKSRLTRKDSDAGKGWRQKEKRVAEDEMVGLHHWLNRNELGQIFRDGEGQGGLACCNP